MSKIYQQHIIFMHIPSPGTLMRAKAAVIANPTGIRTKIRGTQAWNCLNFWIQSLKNQPVKS